ncbi:MAG: ATP-grasp domain-containing protein [Desulfohalobiaceae bacterium]|nr:ATP-grasp domain-containing protein [Desulfohalobiaceae bacterium]
MKKKNVFVVGLNDFNRSFLEQIPHASEYVFHGLLDPAEVLETYEFDIPDMVRRSCEQLKLFQKTTGESVDAVCGYMDFPVSTMLPLICKEFGTKSPSLESLLKCEHKYWSRVEQQKIIPEYIPDFVAFDPFDDQALSRINLPYPFWIKPIKSSGSFLGFRIENEEDFLAAIPQIQAQINLISDPFNYVLSQMKLPLEIAGVGGGFCMAESIIGGRQCTQEGYSRNGQVESMGIVDSIRYENGVSFFRYEYPSTLPYKIQERMQRITETVIPAMGFDDSAFNIEYYWNREQDRIWLLEINTRVSQSHSDVFAKVDGASNQAVTVDVALGRDPAFPYQKGQFPRAAKFFWRLFEDGIVKKVPGQEEIERVHKEMPGTVIRPQVSPGMRLSQLLEQDSYSYAICYLFIGGEDQKDLLDKYIRCQELLSFEVEPLQGIHADEGPNP